MKNYVIYAGIVVMSVALSSVFIKPVQNVVNSTLGAVSGPDSSFPCESHNGLTTCTNRQEFNNASSTLVSFKSPSATSTLTFAAGTITTATSTATLFEWGRSPLLDATSTSLGNFKLAADIKATVLASTTPYTSGLGQTVDYNYVIPPNTFVNLKYGNSLCGATGVTCNSIEGYAVVEFTY